MSKFCFSAMVAVVFSSFAVADEFHCLITKIQDGKITISKYDYKDRKSRKTEASMTLVLGKDVKVYMGILDPKDPNKSRRIPNGEVKDGLQHPAFKRLMGPNPEIERDVWMGMQAYLITDEENKKVVQILRFTSSPPK